MSARSTMQVDVESFSRYINDVKRESGRSSEDMLRYTMILMLTAGRSATPLGHKNRALATFNLPEDTGKDAEPVFGIVDNDPGARFFRVYHQGSHIPKLVFVPRIPRNTKKNAAARASAIKARDAIVARFKKINRRGIAKESWGWAMQRVDRSIRLYSAAETLANDMRSNPIEVTRHLAGTRPFIECINKLGWIRHIAPNIEQQMMNSAGRQMDAWLEKRWQTGIDAAARRAS